MKTIIFIGPPGSGKGTQAAKLSELTGYPHVSMGKVLRGMRGVHPELTAIMQKGDLIPNDLLFSLFKEHIATLGDPEEIIIDGTPRSLEQYEIMRDWFERQGNPIDMVIYIKISESEAIRRLSARREDKTTGVTYNLVTNPPGSDVDSSNLVTRPDDAPESIKERFIVYQELTKPLIEVLKSEGKFVEIDGERSIDEIFNDVKAIFEKK